MNRTAVVAALGAVLAASGAGLGEVSGVEADLDGDGRAERVELVPGDEEGVLGLQVAGSPVEATVRAEGLQTGEAAIREVDLGSGRAAFVLTVPRQDGSAFEALLHRARRGARPTLVWSGLTGLRGDRGSRWGERLVVEDLTGDGRPDVVLASVADEVPLCGVPSPELFPRALDPARGTLRPVLLNRLRGLEGEPVALEARADDPALARPPVVAVASFATASTLAGDRGMVEGLAAPRAIADGDPATAWVEGRPGPGTHEFVTARLLPGPYRLRGLAVTLSPRADEAEVRRLGRLRTFLLTLDGPGGPRRYRVTVPADPAARPGEPLWVGLPEPVEASCLSVVLGEVFPGHAEPVETAIAEVAVYTDLDFEGGVERVVAALDRPDSEVLLRAMGADAIPELAARWDDLDGPARRRAVRVLGGLGEAAAAGLLVRAALGPDEDAAAEGRRGLEALGDAGLDALAGELGAELPARRSAAARLVGSLGSLAAVRLLCARIAEAPPEDLAALREALRAAAAGAGEEGQAAALEVAEGLDEPGPRLALLGGLGALSEAARPRAAALLLDLWASVDEFEPRYRVLALAAGAAPSPELVGLLATEARSDEDQYLRARALESLGALAPEADPALEAFEAAAAGPQVRDRLAAARTLGGAGGRAEPSLTRLLTSDPWPLVRVAAAESLLAASPASAVAALVAALTADRSPFVQARLALLLGRARAAEAVSPLAALAARRDAALEARLAAARGLGQTCSAEAGAALVRLVEEGLARDAEPEDARVGGAAAAALAPYAGAEVTELLVRAASEGPAGLRLAAIEALSARPGDEAARAALEALVEDPLPPVAAAAGAALRRAEVAAPGPTCGD